MFDRLAKDGGMNWYDYRIEAEIHGEPQYAHLIFRDEHKELVSSLVNEARGIFEIMDVEK